jgi:antitoxin (DNA-binding transcriptional repressor) of toxin-antitoxin stability system
MMSTIQAEDTTLPELLRSLHAGDSVVLTVGEAKTPVARIEAIAPVNNGSRRLGFLRNPKFVLPADFFEEDLDDCEASDR